MTGSNSHNNAKPLDADLIIVGAGCSGLALARELAALNYNGQVILIDSKSDFTDDRTWCFWEKSDSYWFKKSRYYWPASSISSNKESYTNNYQHFHYCCIPAIDYYTFCIQSLPKNNFNIHLNYSVSSIQVACTSNQKFEVHATCGTQFTAKHLIDCRPGIINAEYYQSFYGQQVLTDSPWPQKDVACLMHSLQSDNKNIEFVYVLPLSDNCLLIEPTVFSSKPQSPLLLKAKIAIWAAQNNVLITEVTREEKGVLPMGALTSSDVAWPKAGIAAGALRASSGYGFLAMQSWARQAAYQFNTAHTFPVAHQRPKIQLYLDYVFIRVLKRHPELGVVLFQQCAKNMNGDAFARFMSEQATFSDWLKVILAMPSQPFIQEAYKAIFESKKNLLKGFSDG